jgi:hypothetical protein
VHAKKEKLTTKKPLRVSQAHSSSSRGSAPAVCGYPLAMKLPSVCNIFAFILLACCLLFTVTWRELTQHHQQLVRAEQLHLRQSATTGAFGDSQGRSRHARELQIEDDEEKQRRLHKELMRMKEEIYADMFNGTEKADITSRHEPPQPDPRILIVMVSGDSDEYVHYTNVAIETWANTPDVW